jgi:hypothetical protein
MIELKERLCEATKIQMQGWDAHFITLHCISRKVVCDPFLQDDTCRCNGDAMSQHSMRCARVISCSSVLCTGVKIDIACTVACCDQLTHRVQVKYAWSARWRHLTHPHNYIHVRQSNDPLS